MKKNLKALFIIQTLNKAGYTAYFAGGAPRDFLLNMPIDDIDIATSATPDEVIRLFEKTIPVGISFGIVIVVIEEAQFEVATFRQDLGYQDGRRPREVKFCQAEEDAKRRDFTINGMFYDPLKDEILDFVGGKDDLQKKLVRAIGSPEERFKEDRLRMIRAARFAAYLDFEIEKNTKKAIQLYASDLFPHVSIERVWQEFLKAEKKQKLPPMLLLLSKLGLLTVVFPQLSKIGAEKLKEKVADLFSFPKKTPLIIKILKLLSPLPLSSRLEICDKFKLSNQEKKLVEFTFLAEELFTAEEPKKKDLAHFLADTRSDLILKVLASQRTDRESFLKKYEKTKIELLPFIQRIVEHKPVVTSDHLKALGIPPGKTMGLLLKKAEEIAIEENLAHPAPIIDRLKKLDLWPKT